MEKVGGVHYIEFSCHCTAHRHQTSRTTQNTNRKLKKEVELRCNLFHQEDPNLDTCT